MNRMLSAALLGGLLAPVPAFAYEAGDIILRAGATTVAPNDDSDAIVIPTEPATTLPSGVSVDDGLALGLIGTYMVTEHWGVELLAATPFEHDLDADDLGVDAGSTKHLPPTISFQWYPRGNQPGIQPYFGIGLNHTVFFDEDLSGEVSGAVRSLLGASTASLELEDSFGLSAQAGIDIPLNDRWAINAGVWYIDIGTTADIKTDVGTVSFDVDIDPWVYNVGVAYKF